MMVMRVLPGEAITAPRFPLLKSYSSRMILLHFASAGLSGGDHPRPPTTRCMYHDYHSTQRIHTQSNEALFVDRIRIFNRHSHFITQCLLGMRKAYAVLAYVALGFDGIEINIHEVTIRILCILSSRTTHGGRTFDVRGPP